MPDGRADAAQIVNVLIYDIVRSTRGNHEEQETILLRVKGRFDEALQRAQVEPERHDRGDGELFIFKPDPLLDPAVPLRLLEHYGGTSGIRVGIHTGSVNETAQGYVGDGISFAARLLLAARPGQVLCTAIYGSHAARLNARTEPMFGPIRRVRVKYGERYEVRNVTDGNFGVPHEPGLRMGLPAIAGLIAVIAAGLVFAIGPQANPDKGGPPDLATARAIDGESRRDDATKGEKGEKTGAPTDAKKPAAEPEKPAEPPERAPPETPKTPKTNKRTKKNEEDSTKARKVDTKAPAPSTPAGKTPAAKPRGGQKTFQDEVNDLSDDMSRGADRS